jgi:hypothetical protein
MAEDSRLRFRAASDCMKCNQAPSNTVHHILTKAQGGTDDESNLQARYIVSVTAERQR